ncbi:GAF domain-containing protein [Candidatus Gracilibacteria bacterium]|nr:GAF domain-containing protein [Candidatus Gracilibacteria bacterium]
MALDTNEALTARLQAVTAAFSRALTPAQIGEVIVNECLSALEAQAGGLCVLSDDGSCLELLAGRGFNAEDIEHWQRIPASQIIPVTVALRQRTPIRLSSFADWQRDYPDLLPLMQRYNLPALIAMPLIHDERVLGVLSFNFSAPRQFAATDIAFLTALSQQCAQALERAHLYASERSARTIAEAVQRWLVFLNEASAILASSLDYKRTIGVVLSKAVPTFADVAVCNLLQGDAIQPIAVATQPHQADLVHQLIWRYPVHLGNRDGIAKVIRSGRAVLLTTIDPSFISNDSVDADHVQLLTELQLVSYLCVPISISGTRSARGPGASPTRGGILRGTIWRWRKNWRGVSRSRSRTSVSTMLSAWRVKPLRQPPSAPCACGRSARHWAKRLRRVMWQTSLYSRYTTQCKRARCGSRSLLKRAMPYAGLVPWAMGKGRSTLRHGCRCICHRL